MPLYLHTFRLIAPRKVIEAQLFNRQYQRYQDINNVPDRLRWLRHDQGLMQMEVAQALGVSRGIYHSIECGVTQQIPKEMVDALSKLYGVPASDFVDEFNQFLHDGPADRIRAYRLRLGMGRQEFSYFTGASLCSIRGWETGKIKISYKCWERYFKGRA